MHRMSEPRNKNKKHEKRDWLLSAVQPPDSPTGPLRSDCRQTRWKMMEGLGSTNGQICMFSTHLKNLYVWATYVYILYKFTTIHIYNYIHDMRIMLLQKRTLHHDHRNIWWHSVIAQKIRFTTLWGAASSILTLKLKHRNTKKTQYHQYQTVQRGVN